MLGAVHLSYNLGSAYDALRSEKLSDQFDRKLNLPRRTSFACRKASICDSTEGWRSNNIAWLTKVRMIKEIKKLRPELQVKIIAEPGVLDN